MHTCSSPQSSKFLQANVEPIHVLVIDDDPIVCQSLTLYFTTAEDIQVECALSNSYRALEWLQEHHCDVILSDLRMPGITGIELLHRIQDFDDPPVFVAMTAYDTDEAMLDVLSKGAAGYVIKSAPPRTIIQAVRDAYCGGTSLSPVCIKRLIQYLGTPKHRQVNPKYKEFSTLTKEEQTIIRLITKGKTNKQIAQELNYAESTIKTKVSSLYKRLKVSSRPMLVALCAQFQQAHTPDVGSAEN